MSAPPIVIDIEFSSWLPPLTEDEKRGLEAMISKEGCREPLIVWPDGGKLLLVDGHNRYLICNKLGVEFQTVEKQFESREAVIDWITQNQLGKRNLTLEARTYLIGKTYERLKTKRGGNKKPENTQQFTKTQRLRFGETPRETAAETVAEQAKVSPRTVDNAARFARSVDKIKQNVGAEAAEAILTRKQPIKRKDVDSLATASAKDPEGVRAAIAGEKPVSKVLGTAKPFAVPKPKAFAGEQLSQRQLQGLIWELGIKLLAACDQMEDAQARRFIGKMIQDSKGREELAAAAIAMTAWKFPAEAASYVRAVHQKLLALSLEKANGKESNYERNKRLLREAEEKGAL